MRSKFLRSLPTCMFITKAMQLLLASFFFLICLQSNAQTFYYFETKFSPQVKPAVNYYILLYVEADGSATARIRYKDPITNSARRAEQSFIDSSDFNNVAAPDSSKKFLMAPASPGFLLDDDPNFISDPNYITPRFIFQKKTDSTELYFEPIAIEYKGTDQKWHAAETTIIQQKSFADLRANKDTTQIFYNPGEDLYKYIFEFNSRGLDIKELKTKIHLIAVANTVDKSIGSSSKKDLDRVTTTFRTVADELAIQLDTITIFGNNFNKANVQKAIDKLKPAPDDIVVFYYSGHGFRYPTDSSEYARMSFRIDPSADLKANNLGIEDIYKQLLKKHAKFTLVLGDCCNRLVEGFIPKGGEPLKTKGTGTEGLKLNVDNFKTLFLAKDLKSILIGSANKNQFALGNPKLGGFFTNYFIAELTNNLYTGAQTVGWPVLLTAAKAKATYWSTSALCVDDNCTTCPKKRCFQRAITKPNFDN
jgi:hypothetical protein